MSDLGATLIKAKDAIHTDWFELQRSKQSNPEYAFLQKPLYDSIVEIATEALSELEEVKPESIYISRIEGVLGELQWKSNVADETRIGTKTYYAMTPSRGEEAITQDINRLANEIHHAGMDLIKAQQQYCGCDLSIVADLRSINTGVLRYCEGALKLGHKRGWVHEPGDKVEHKPGAADQHAAVTKFEPTEKGYDLDIEYVESGDGSWRLRQAGVIRFIEEKGGKCEVAGTGSLCKVKDASEKDILDLALLISQLKDIDLMEPKCIPLAFEEITSQANELREIEPKEDIWQAPWTRAGSIQSVQECQGQTEEEPTDRATRLGAIYERLQADIEGYADEINYAIAHAKDDPCTCKPYRRLDDADYKGDIRDACHRIKAETDEPWGWCLELAKDREQDRTRAAKDLVERCPPESIILGLEAASYPGYPCHEIEQVSQICQLAENQDCLDIIKQVLVRSEAGVKVEELPLQMREREGR